MEGAASILHADLDAFYASVEQRDNPALRGKPVIVGGGVVLAASYEAKALGVRTATGVRQAKALCPDATVVPARMTAYSEASKAVFEVFREAAPVVEAISIDEAFLEVGGMEHISGTPAQIAAKLRADVLEQVGLPITVGVAQTKFIAKVASGVAKPDGLLIVEPGSELEFLHPLAIERLWGVGKVTSRKLHAIGIRTIGDIASVDSVRLELAVGKAAARKLTDLANARDPRRVAPRERRRSIGAQRALPRSAQAADLDAIVLSLVERTSGRLRKSHRQARTVTLRMRLGDFSNITRSKTLRDATDQTTALLAAARELLAVARPMIDQGGITLIGVALENLDSADAVQMTLAYEPDSSELDSTLDELRDRFGKGAITRAALLHRDEGISVPVLPD